MTIDIGDDANLDHILSEVGEFGPFQVATYLIFCIPTILSASYAVNYMISANTLDYRCKVPDCDVGNNNRDISYDQPWLHDAIPLTNGKFDSCSYFARKNATIPNQCTADMFDKSKRIQCTEFIYASDERNIQTEFNIHCLDETKLALVGTLNNLGRVLLLPLTGLLSDRFGRLTVVVVGMQLNSIFGMIKTFSINYPMYVALEFMESAAAATSFEGSYVLAIEWVNSKHRVMGGTIISIAYAIGEMLVGFVAMYIHDYRVMSRILYLPGLFVFTYFWLVPESVRWLLVTGRVERAIKILKRTAKINHKELSPKSIEVLKLKYSTPPKLQIHSIEAKAIESSDSNDTIEHHSLIQSLRDICKSRTLCLRFVNCCYQWAAGCFGYYVLSLSSTHIPGANRYVSFIFVMAVEIPGLIMAQILLSRMKRRSMMPAMLCLAAFSIIAAPFIPKEYSTVVLLFFLLGKASMTCAYTAMFVFTAELWPTNIRTTIMNSCLMFGRIGSMMAPLTVLLDAKIPSFSALFMGGTAIAAAICVLFCPETYSKKLPDTISEAKEL